MKNSSDLKSTLIRSFNQNRLPHSFLVWSNTAESSKIDFVTSIAALVLKPKKERTEEKLKELLLSGSYSDFIIIKPQEKGNIKTEDIEKLDDLLSYSPYESENRVIMISHAEKMTIQAQNSLLKKLEEPPENNYFFLNVKKKNSLLSTITSRTIPLYLPPAVNQVNPDDDVSGYFPFFKEFENGESDTISIDAEKSIANDALYSIRKKTFSGIVEATRILSAMLNNQNQQQRVIQLKIRLAYISIAIKEQHPELSENIALFMENRQVFSTDAMLYSNLIDIFMNILSEH